IKDEKGKCCWRRPGTGLFAENVAAGKNAPALQKPEIFDCRKPGDWGAADCFSGAICSKH
ncbi:hypothetical protein, partial [Thiolapillus sp.]